MGFLVTLPSNSSESTFPENTIANFTTYLPQEITLDGEYEAALCEIQYTNLFYNVPDDCDIILRMTQFNGENLASEGVEKNVTVKKGYYKDIDDFITMLKRVILKEVPNPMKADFDIRYNDITRRVKFVIPKNTMNFKILFPECL